MKFITPFYSSFIKKYNLNSHKKYLIISILLFILLSQCSCQRNTEPYSKSGVYFDTYVTISVYDNISSQKAQKVLDNCMELCNKYENMFSKTIPESDIYRINHANGEPVTVQSDTIKVLYTALNYCDYTDGLVDVTIGGVKDLWEFDPDKSCTPPSKELIKETLTHVDYHKITIKGSTVTLQDRDAQLDLGFIAKGYIADEIKALLISENINNALINLGGNIQTLGSRPDKSPFTIGIQKPFSKNGDYITTVSISDSKDTYSSIATSGIYERYFKYGDDIYHHILNAKTGYPVKNNLYSATILCNSSINADALSTTCMLLGLERATELINSLDEADAIFITDKLEIIDTRK